MLSGKFFCFFFAVFLFLTSSFYLSNGQLVTFLGSCPLGIYPKGTKILHPYPGTLNLESRYRPKRKYLSPKAKPWTVSLRCAAGLAMLQHLF